MGVIADSLMKRKRKKKAGPKLQMVLGDYNTGTLVPASAAGTAYRNQGIASKLASRRKA